MIIRLNDVEPKDPSESKIYTMNWAGGLNSATISTSTWSIQPTGATSAATANDDTTASIRVAGGVDGTDYEVSNTITTSASETLKRTGILPVRVQ